MPGQITTQAIPAARAAERARETLAADALTARHEAEFLTLVSYELRSPLTAIKGYAATLRRHGRRLPLDDRDSFLRAIIDASDQLETMVARFTELAELDAALVTPCLEAVNLTSLIREARANAERRWGAETLGATGHRFLFAVQVDLPMARADLRLQRQALDIVLENAAIHATPGSDIYISAKRGRLGVTIAVHDYGETIPPERIESVFERGNQADSGLTHEQGGLGVGLALCKRIMELQGGDIWMESYPTSGTVVSMSLPRCSLIAHQIARQTNNER
jgi:signal transduction histidine kinase